MKSVFALVFLVSTSVFAAPVSSVTVDQPVCFGREYSQAHMNKTPQQTVKKLFVKFKKYSKDDLYYIMDVNADIKKESVSKNDDGTKDVYVTYKPYRNGMVCDRATSTSLNCYIECDGGSAAVSWTASEDGKVITLTNNGFQLYGGCGEDENDMNNWIYLEATKGGDDVFKLYALPQEYCQI